MIIKKPQYHVLTVTANVFSPEVKKYCLKETIKIGKLPY